VAEILATGIIVRPRPRWRPGPALKKIFARTLYSANSPPGPGALVRPDKLPPAFEPPPRVVTRNVPAPFDLIAIVAAPASGTTTTLVTTGMIGRIPRGYRAVIDGITTILEGAVGPIAGPRIPGAGVTIAWRLLVDGNAAYPYNNITTIINDIGQDRPLFEIPPDRQLTVDVTNTDPAGLYAYLGVRIRGRYLPWEYDRKAGR
jgi:hypothetical protein